MTTRDVKDIKDIDINIDVKNRKIIINKFCTCPK